MAEFGDLKDRMFILLKWLSNYGIDENLIKAFARSQYTLWFTYAVVYLIHTFVIWEFTNPFQWMINIPTYSELDRFLILSGWALGQTVLVAVWHGVIADELKTKN